MKNQVLWLSVSATGLFCLFGCAPSRTAYYDDMYERRESRYEMWRDDVDEDHSPRIDGELRSAEAVRIAFQHSPGLAAARQLREEARGAVVGSYSAALPRLNLNAGYTRLDEVQEIDLGFETFESGDLDNYNLGLEVTQPIYRAAAPVARRGAQLFSFLSEESFREAEENMIFQVSSAYYHALLAEKLVQVEEAALESAEAQLEAARERRREGVAREYDVLRARVELSNIEAELIERKNEKETAYTDLLTVMGVSQKSEVELTGELETAEHETPSYEEAVRVAFRHRPDIFQSAIEVDMAEEELQEVRTRYYPTLDFFFQQDWNSGGSQIGGGQSDDAWRTGLRLNWSLFDGLAREGDMIQKQAQLERRRIMLDDLEQRVAREVKDALLEIESSEKMVESQKLNLRRAEETERLVQEGYREGINTELELIDTRSALTQTRGLYYRAIYRRKMAMLNLRRVLGKLTEEREDEI